MIHAPLTTAGGGCPALDHGPVRRMAHVDLSVDDLEVAGRHAETCGAALTDHQPPDHVRVYLDPAGHPFCLFRTGG